MKMRRVVYRFALGGLAFVCGILLIYGVRPGNPARSDPGCVPGDVNGDRTMDITDSIYLLQNLFMGGKPPVVCAQDSAALDTLNAALNNIVVLMKRATANQDWSATLGEAPFTTYMKIGDIKGEVLEQNHANWLECHDVKAGLLRTIQEGATGVGRAQGSTSLDEVVVTRPLDKASVKVAEASATGKYFDEVEIDCIAVVMERSIPFLVYRLKDVIVTQYEQCGSFERVSLNYSHADLTYTIIDRRTGNITGSVTGRLTP
jgi:type VI secretion system secreted protein Hcp